MLTLEMSEPQFQWMMGTEAGRTFKRDGHSRWVENTELGVKVTWNFIMKRWTIELIGEE